MSEISGAQITAEQFAQRAVDLGLLDQRQLESIWTDLGTRNITAQELESAMLQRGLLTNLQVDKLIKLITKNERWNFFYGKYKVLYLVGEGSFARVYRAVHSETGQVHALKVLRQRFANDPGTIEQFLLEAKMVMQLRHINIVPIYEVDTERGRPYMIMEFVEGRNLREFVRVRKKLPVDESLRLITDIASGLEFALTKNMTHRDLKLSNVLVTSLGRAKLVDFGLAALAAAIEEGLLQGTSARSIHYAGLERVTGVRKDDARSDIYFTGCILYHMLTGQSPLAETRERSQLLSVSRYREVVPIGQLDPSLPRPIVSLVSKAMDLDPDKRHQTPSELLADIKLTTMHLQQGVVPSGAGGDAAPGERAGPIEMEGTNKTVMVVESSSERQNLFREQLKRRGYRVLVIGDPARALARFQDATEKVADIALFCSTGLKEKAVEGFNQFGADPNTQNLPAVLFIDEEDKALAERAKTDKHRVILAAPLTVRGLRVTLMKLLQSAPPAS